MQLNGFQNDLKCKQIVLKWSEMQKTVFKWFKMQPNRIKWSEM